MLTGIIFDIKKFAVNDGPGIRTTVFFKGCCMDCRWCQNPEGKNPDPEIINLVINKKNSLQSNGEKAELFGYEISVPELVKELKKDEIFYEQSGGGITISGGEPLMQIEFLTELLKQCKYYQYHTALDTTGYAAYEDFEKIYDLIDLFLYDLKIMDDSEHLKYTGVSNRQILDNLKKLSDKGDKLVIRIPLIPDITDTEKNLKAIADFLLAQKSINKISVLPYNELSEDKFKRFDLEKKVGNLKRQSGVEIEEKSRLFTQCGFDVKIGG